MVEQRFSRILRSTWIAAGILTIVLPMMWIVIASLKSPADLTDATKIAFTPTGENWANALASGLPAALLRSLIVGVVVVAVSLVVGVPGAYALARYGVGGTPLGFVLLMAQVLPPAVLVFPFLRLSHLLKTNGTIAALIPAHISFVLPVVVWLLIGFFASVPVSIEEQARIDGKSRLGAFWSVVIPHVRPGIGAACVFGFSLSWNDMFYSLILVPGSAQTLPLTIAGFNTFRGIELGTMSAAILLASIPMLIATFFIQKHLVQGLGGNGVKY